MRVNVPKNTLRIVHSAIFFFQKNGLWRGLWRGKILKPEQLAIDTVAYTIERIDYHLKRMTESKYEAAMRNTMFYSRRASSHSETVTRKI